MTSSPLDDAAPPTSREGTVAAPEGASQKKRPAERPKSKRPATKRPAPKNPAPKESIASDEAAKEGPARKPAAPRKPAVPRKSAAKGKSEAKGSVTSGARPRSGTKTSAARNASGRTAVPQPAPAGGSRVDASAADASTVGPVPVEAEPARREEAVIEDAPVTAAPVEEAPVEEAPVEAAAVEDVPAAEPASAAASAAEVGVEEAPASSDAVSPGAVSPGAVAPDAVSGEEPEVAAAPAAPVSPRPDPVPALVLHGVSRAYGGTTAVAGIDLTVPAGSFYGLVGPNGAGKTTTMSMIAGLLRPDRGEITVAGVDLAADPRAAKALMGVLPDRLRTFDRLTGRQLLYYFGVLRGLKPDVVAQRTADLARAFDLTEALGRVVSDYSAGMTKKVMLAGAMIHSPRLLVLDEPFEAVDPVSSANILDILSAYVAHGGTVLLSSHGMDLIERVCTRVAVIVAGQVLAEGTVEEVRGELTLEQRFVELSGEVSSMEGLEWLHTFSD
ncbi:ATP-binding cassette domain-containing protein [Microbacterium sp. NPDC096154]|uniref:ATP-binding cassette domain-containing protein n=1 Tax=Microbacterium sp. NPDC096154 TaxID=3155549 RepID=UPI00331C5890